MERLQNIFSDIPGGALALCARPELWAKYYPLLRAARKAELKANPLQPCITTPRGTIMGAKGLLVASDEAHTHAKAQAYSQEIERNAQTSHALRLRDEFDELARVGDEDDFVFECASRRLYQDEIIEAGLITGLNGLTHETMSVIDADSVLWSALWTVGIFRGAGDETPFFASIDEALTWRYTGGMIWPCQGLDRLFHTHNPDIFKRGERSSQAKGQGDSFTVEPYPAAPEAPVTDMDLLLWAAYWAPFVSERLGTLRECLRGERAAIRETAQSYFMLVGVIEREQKQQARQIEWAGWRIHARPEREY